MSYSYKNGSWSYVAGGENTNNNNNREEEVSNSGSSSSTSALNSSPTLVPEYSDNNDTTKTKDNADKQIEIQVIEGEIKITSPIPLLKAKTTVFLTGIGRNLTGLYYVSKVKHTINKTSGYTQSATVSKSGFGDSLKKGNVSTGLSDWWDSTDSTGRPKKLFSTIKYTTNKI